MYDLKGPFLRDHLNTFHFSFAAPEAFHSEALEKGGC